MIDEYHKLIGLIYDGIWMMPIGTLSWNAWR